MSDRWEDHHVSEHQDDDGVDHLCLPIGTVFNDPKSDKHYVFVGWRRNTVSHEAVFCELYYRNKVYPPWSPQEPWIYHATRLGTLCRKFPDLKKWIKLDGDAKTPA